ncbi:hypothetical protein JOC34_000571 [Virgibacillus halotolerans]|uniref:hypothetical protein n=1 Tax=Virgibacillus halotolerans TaxID=1071053 RepID=UPI0019604FA3|nr:hypothetical protein [Virgibacillus halotolerans]MBM7598214.1 hypothetical protein [Virgibacillus halotolerans]
MAKRDEDKVLYDLLAYFDKNYADASIEQKNMYVRGVSDALSYVYHGRMKPR